MTTAADRRRLGDGERALQEDVSNLPGLTLPELKALKEKLFDGAVALQSMDSLGSVEANNRAWDIMTALEERFEKVKDEIKLRETTCP